MEHQQIRRLLRERFGACPSAYVHSFGCQQNQSDGEKIKGVLEECGFDFCDAPEQADLVLFNTCAVRENAEDRVFGHVGALKPVKERRPLMMIGICGCMTQQEVVSEKIRKSYPYVDLVLGTNQIQKLPELLQNRLQGDKRQFATEQADGEIYEGLPLVRDSKIFANLPVMYGCDNFCSYCIVPYVRGRERSRLPEHIINEAKELVAAGYKDITLLGQNVNSYGKGLALPLNFAQLLRQLDDVDGEYRLRFMTSHPKDCSKELLAVIAHSRHIPHHLHLPVQSGSNRVLQKMNRRYTREQYLETIDYAKKIMPDITLSSDIIVGFPGEQYEDFQQTLSLIQQVRYNGLFTFLYSPRTGTKAVHLPDPVSEQEKGRWFRELLEAQNIIREELQQALVDKTVPVLAEHFEDGILFGRTASNDIAQFSGKENLVGKFVNIAIRRARNSAVYGEIERKE